MKKFFPALALLMAAAAVSAQSAQKISQIVESPELSYGQAAYIAMSYSEMGGGYNRRKFVRL